MTIALISIARPTVDVLLAQSVANVVAARLAAAGHQVVGTGAVRAVGRLSIDNLAQGGYDLLVLLQATVADASMAVQIALVNDANTPQDALRSSRRE